MRFYVVAACSAGDIINACKLFMHMRTPSRCMVLRDGSTGKKYSAFQVQEILKNGYLSNIEF